MGGWKGGGPCPRFAFISSSSFSDHFFPAAWVFLVPASILPRFGGRADGSGGRRGTRARRGKEGLGGKKVKKKELFKVSGSWVIFAFFDRSLYVYSHSEGQAFTAFCSSPPSFHARSETLTSRATDSCVPRHLAPLSSSINRPSQALPHAPS